MTLWVVTSRIIFIERAENNFGPAGAVGYVTSTGGNTMGNKWLEDAFNAFQQYTGGIDATSLKHMMLALEYWAEEKELDLTEARRTAKDFKQMFDGADKLVKEGFDPHQVSLILQYHFDGGLLGCRAHSDSPDEEDYISAAGLKIHEDAAAN
jgi:hypothetical protein